MADADAKDFRNLYDVKRALSEEETSYEYAANPVLAAPSSNRRENLANDQRTLVALRATIEQILKLTSKDSDLEIDLAYTQVRLGEVGHDLNDHGEWAALSKAGLAAAILNGTKGAPGSGKAMAHRWRVPAPAQ